MIFFDFPLSKIGIKYVINVDNTFRADRTAKKSANGRGKIHLWSYLKL